jgi:hypothetical protein
MRCRTIQSLKLTPAETEAMYLYYCEGWTLLRIGEMWKTSRIRVYQDLSSGRRKILRAGLKLPTRQVATNDHRLISMSHEAMDALAYAR